MPMTLEQIEAVVLKPPEQAQEELRGEERPCWAFQEVCDLFSLQS